MVSALASYSLAFEPAAQTSTCTINNASSLPASERTSVPLKPATTWCASSIAHPSFDSFENLLESKTSNRRRSPSSYGLTSPAKCQSGFRLSSMVLVLTCAPGLPGILHTQYGSDFPKRSALRKPLPLWIITRTCLGATPTTCSRMSLALASCSVVFAPASQMSTFTSNNASVLPASESVNCP